MPGSDTPHRHQTVTNPSQAGWKGLNDSSALEGPVQGAQGNVGRIPAKLSELAQSCACPKSLVKQGVDMAAPHWWHVFYENQNQQHLLVDKAELRPQLGRQAAALDREFFWMLTPISVQAPLDYLVGLGLIAEELHPQRVFGAL